jgi:hypothetical protein
VPWNKVCRKNVYFVGFEDLTAVVFKSTIFWDITPCGPLKANWRFGGTYCLHLQDRETSRARNQVESRWQAGLWWFLARLIYRSRKWRRYIPPKRRLSLNGLHGVISQKTVVLSLLFVVYLMTLTVTHITSRRIVGWLVRNDLRNTGRVWSPISAFVSEDSKLRNSPVRTSGIDTDIWTGASRVQSNCYPSDQLL